MSAEKRVEEGSRNPWNLPEPFMAKMQQLLGAEYDEFIRSYDTERVQGLRFNGLKGNPAQMYEKNRERFDLTPVPWCREGFYYRQETRPGRHPFHEAGVYYIQEPSAMAVVSLLDPQPGERVLDLCAAPGGKTTHIASRLCGQGLLVSNEIHPARAKILSQNVERMGIGNGVVTNEDSEKLKVYFPEFFDAMVVDAPCSGEGMFRKDEQARAEWSETNVRICAERQQEILDNAAAMLRPGGRMIYSTCTFSPEEDEAGIAAFLDRHPEFSVVRVPEEKRLPGLSAGRAEWSGRRAELAGDLAGSAGDSAGSAGSPTESAGSLAHPEVADTFRIWPHRAEGEGHYLALLTKAEAEEGYRPPRIRCPKYWNDKQGGKILEEFLKDTLKENPGNADAEKKENLILFGDQIYRIPEEMPEFNGLRVLRPGLHLGTLKKNRLEPSHALALYLHPEQVKRSISLKADGPQILDYLKGNTLADDEGRKGWTLVCVDGYSVGWAKAVSGTLKNHYPKGLRI
ncbi:MAG: RsmB/NOP family class I SAM-dependent RNA methyltransferase [Eubacteriales bacterium]|nr:RsmB/NOP family class I SAM-dependent RNA methyltransferase [Eubacteriales bacterium]